MKPPGPILVAMGSNIEPGRNLVRAVSLLEELVAVAARSSVYESDPVGSSGDRLFLNAAVRLETALPARELKFSVLREIEHRLGRRRSSDRNAPRTIDLDLALYGDMVIRTSDLVLPDPDIGRLAHVAVPLAEIAPTATHPVEGVTLAEIANRFRETDSIRRAAGYSLAAREE